MSDPGTDSETRTNAGSLREVGVRSQKRLLSSGAGGRKLPPPGRTDPPRCNRSQMSSRHFRFGTGWFTCSDEVPFHFSISFMVRGVGVGCCGTHSLTQSQPASDARRETQPEGSGENRGGRVHKHVPVGGAHLHNKLFVHTVLNCRSQSRMSAGFYLILFTKGFKKLIQDT